MTPQDRAKSCNSLGLEFLNIAEQKVLETIEKSPYPITPIEIASETGISHMHAT